MNTYIVSVVVIKNTSTGFNTQNKLYEISAVSDDEAKGKVLGFISTDFPEHSLHTILTALVTPNPWQQAIDDELVNAHLGIAQDEVTREEAKAELNKLIAWHIDVAKYFDSQAQQPTDLSKQLREYADDSGYSHNDYADTMLAAASEIERSAARLAASQAQQPDWLLKSTQDLATSLWQKHYKSESPVFEVLNDLAGVISQIDNMTTGLVRLQSQAQQEPVAEIVACYVPSGKNAVLYTQYQSLPIGTKLYAIPPAPEGGDK